MNEANDNAPQTFNESGSASARRVQLVSAGASQFGIFADDVAAIVAWREPTPLPNAPKAVLGVVSIQGRMLTVLELASLTTVEAVSIETPREAAGEMPPYLIALRGDEQLALAVEDVDGVIEFPAAELTELRETAGALALGVVQSAVGDVNILNLKELFPAAIQGRERRRRRF
jgi:chemotaxis signal transduction protein